ncbi:SixA phosphatase family protein [Aquimarina mytili]|uniref:Histidine phosphatase family protein n=1 Tax=Aquimarina mytili TaxID=874423 RepID=A0A936ZPZ4_9FLAO|nr:phosphoglycerate mutase family protein [Aquimarina mytili]MBL0682563.1 histidine phosphatase family protein [Aquimarina mytili]
MKKLLVLFFALFSLVGFAQEPEIKQTTTTYFFIRHAEKEIKNTPKNRNPLLSETGKIRAQKWAELFSDTAVDMIYTTDYIRTRQTAKPIAENQGLQVSLYDPRNIYDLDFQQQTKGKTVIIVGHSNTTPLFVNTILKKEKYSQINEKDYGKLFIVKITENIITDTILNIN